MEYIRTLLLSVFVAITLSACGGSGGVGGGVQLPVAGAAININEANAVPITAAVVASVEAVQGLVEGGSGNIVGVASSWSSWAGLPWCGNRRC